MSDSNGSLALLARYRQGDSAAWEQLLGCYVQRLIAVCRGRMGVAIQGRHDAQDAAQSALASLLRWKQANPSKFDEANDLWPLLLSIGLCKVSKYARRVKKDPARKRLSAEELVEVLASDPDREEADAMKALFEKVLLGFSVQHGELLRLLLEGQTPAEVAAALGVPLRKVYRVRELFRKRAARAEADA